MGSLTAAASLQLRVELHGILLGRPTDLLIDTEGWHVLGYVVHCGDDSVRFLPYAAAQTSEDGIAVGSALMLLEDVEFYEKRGTSFRALTGCEVGAAGVLRDLVIGPGGAVTELAVEHDGAMRRVPATRRAVATPRLSAA
ncbi:MAG TPA: hypothetical protein VGH82_15060 [Gaiellaceae bacterium]|jgi:hypothetical protein